MPKNRPGRIYYDTAATTHLHGAPVVYHGFAGIAVKQKHVSHTEGTGDNVQTTIQNGEDFAIIVKGVVEVPTVSGAAKGDLLYITSGHVLTESSGGNTAFGRVTEVAGERGTATGYQRVDLDHKA